jgi:hypothetical protein
VVHVGSPCALSQQIRVEPSPPQHIDPQHSSPTGQSCPLQAGISHLWSWQYVTPVHVVPQPPQLCGSFASFTHAPLQHVWPVPQGVGQAAPELEELDELDVVPMQHERQPGA